MSIAEEKDRLRKEGLAARGAIRTQAGPEAADALAAAFFAHIGLEPGDVISAFWPMGDEIDVRPLMHRLAEKGHVIGLPVVTKRGEPLTFRAWRPGDALKRMAFGVEEPTPDKTEVTPSLVIAPLLFWDDDGYRLGYGGGYYDRTIRRLRATGKTLAVGVGFHGQWRTSVPHESFDERLDWIVTERGAKALR